MKQVLFIRHGSTAGNLERRYIGRTDEPLCDLGMDQIQQLREQALHADCLFVSPMTRTRQTAQILFPGVQGELVPDFRETDFGIFEGKTYRELSDSEAYQAWLDSNCQGPVPEGECNGDFKRRCCKAFQQVIAQVPEGKTVALVVHGGTIMAILEAYAQPKEDFYHYHIGNGAYLTCSYEDGVLRLQDV